MIVKRVDIWHLNLAFLSPIKHNLATHVGSENIVVKVTTHRSLAGYGEGVPRAFVTGERLEDSLSFLQEVLVPAALTWKAPSPQALLGHLDDLYYTAGARQYPAAFCALEMALLDAAGRTWNMPVANFIGPQAKASVTYSAVVPMASAPQLTQFFDLVKMGHFRFLKLKVGNDDDLQVLRLARERLGWEMDIRVDANGAWSAPEAIARIRAMAPYRISAVEQPVAKADFQGLQEVSAALEIPVIADESLCNEEDAERLLRLQACRIFNLRLSKCGGLRAATRIRRMAEKAGVRCQLGCHVGETSILAAAGRHFALCAPELAYIEGSLAPFLLTRDPVAQPVVFNHGGLGYQLPGPGLGVAVLDHVLHELAIASQVAEAA